MIHHFLNVTSLTRSLVLILSRNPLLHLLKDNDKAKTLICEVQLSIVLLRNRIIDMTVENLISLNVEEKVIQYNLCLHNL